jgi:glycosyltransferase involved in cell wall biosynthesis
MVASPDLQISVLIATRNRAALLGKLLRSLDTTRAAAAVGSEIIVVDNGSTDVTPELLEHWRAEDSGHVHVREPQPGKSRALNRALRVARGTLLAFVDDDEAVGTAWMAEMAAFFATHPYYDAAIGRVLAPPDVRDREVLTRLAAYRTIALFDHGDTVRDEQMLHGANMVLRRRVFDQIGGFNEALGPGATGGCEDTELGLRVIRAGMRIGYMPRVQVFHVIEPERLTARYFHDFELRVARSRFAMDPAAAGRRALSHAIEAGIGWMWWSLLRHRIRRERARGRFIRHREILRLHCARRAESAPARQ